MTNPHAAEPMTFALAFTNRLHQLGMSRRELMRRTGLARQTFHNIEHEGRTSLNPTTMQALDKGLHWHPGTTAALCRGDFSVLEDADEWIAREREGATRWRIVERLTRLTIADLERLEAILDGEGLGTADDTSTVDPMAELEARIIATLEQRMAATHTRPIPANHGL